MQNLGIKGLKIMELASVLAGPAVGLFFAELGNEVIKIENKKTGGDITRQWKLPSESAQNDWSAYYCSVNWHKKVLMLDLEDSKDLAIVNQLVKEADIVISNFKPDSAKKLKIDYESMYKINPTIIYGQLLSFPDDEKRPAFDVVLQAETGFLHMTGFPDREAVKMPVALIDILAAHQLKEGVLVALIKRLQTGVGSLVTTSLYEAAIASLANQATNWLMEGHIPQRMGSMHPNISPYGDIFYTKEDQAIVLAVGTDFQFNKLCKCLDLVDLIEDERFNKNANRLKNRKTLNELLARAFKKYDSKTIVESLLEAKVPMGSINDMKAVFENKAAQKMVLEEKLKNNTISKRVKTVAFTIK